MKLGKHFDLSEFCTSQTAARHGISMIPTGPVIRNLRDLVTNVLDPLREELGRPMVVSSGWRPQRLNALIGGASSSQHVLGEAADIIVPGISVKDVCHTVIRLRLPFDQIIYEFGSWTHISYRMGRCRGQSLTAKKVGKRTVYEVGLPK